MRAYGQQLLPRLWEEPGTAAAGWGWRAAAGLLAKVYEIVVRSRRYLYERGWFSRYRLPCPVISLGNLTVGGTGKTPLTILVARQIKAAGKRVVILTRGYGGSQRRPVVISDGQEIFQRPPQCGDEAFLMARKLPGVPVVSGAKRVAAGELAWREFQPDLMLVDDGLQHLPLARDLDLVLVDADRPWGNGRLLPRGPLREPMALLRPRRLILVLTRYEPTRHLSTYQKLSQDFPGVPLCRAVFSLEEAERQPGEVQVSLAEIATRPLLGFAGIAYPSRFAASLAAEGVKLVFFQPFADHQLLTAADLRQLLRRAQDLGAAGLVTTEKDWCRLGASWSGELPLYVVSLEVKLLDPWPEDLRNLAGL